MNLKMKNKLILASTSPYRQALLSRLGIPFEVKKPLCDEEDLKKSFHGKISDLAEFLSCEKAKSVPKAPEDIIIGSDQLLLFKNEVLGKSHHYSKAFETLEKLQGQTHQLITSVCVLRSHSPIVFTNTTELTMKPLSNYQIESYLKKDEPYDCAGSYKIEKSGIALFSEIKTDDFTAIEGLPLLQLSKTLSQLNLEVFSQ